MTESQSRSSDGVIPTPRSKCLQRLTWLQAKRGKHTHCNSAQRFRPTHTRANRSLTRGDKLKDTVTPPLRTTRIKLVPGTALMAVVPQPQSAGASLRSPRRREEAAGTGAGGRKGAAAVAAGKGQAGSQAHGPSHLSSVLSSSSCGGHGRFGLKCRDESWPRVGSFPKGPPPFTPAPEPRRLPIGRLSGNPGTGPPLWAPWRPSLAGSERQGEEPKETLPEGVLVRQYVGRLSGARLSRKVLRPAAPLWALSTFVLFSSRWWPHGR